MAPKTVRSSTIFIAVDGKTQVFRSVKEVPPKLRKRLVETTSGTNSATILIADKKGREELVRAIQGIPGSLEFRVTNEAQRRRSQRETENARQSRRNWIEIGLMLLLALSIWLLVLWK
jgi:hypothetical protein